MSHYEYEDVCNATAGGEDHLVENLKTHDVGRIINCRRDYFNVQVGEGWRVWSREDCEEKTA